MIEAHFENIRNLIRSNISITQSEIKIAVAWFTQRELFSEVLGALNRGVDVSMIIIKDFINCGMYGLPLQQFVEAGGHLHFVSDRSWTMHNKFCLFDNNLVITGSYNWTYSAETRNAENVILTDDNSVCQDYNNYFTRLWEESQEESQMPLIEISSEDVIKDFSTIHDEIDAMLRDEIIPTGNALEVLKEAKSKADSKLATVERPIMPSLQPNKQIAKKESVIPQPVYFDGYQLKPGERLLMKTLSLPLAFGSITLVERGSRLPIRNISITLENVDTISDKKQELVLDKWPSYGIGSVFLFSFEELPLLPAGKVKVKAGMSISKDGALSFYAVCTNTGERKRAEIQLIEGEDFIIGK